MAGFGVRSQTNSYLSQFRELSVDYKDGKGLAKLLSVEEMDSWRQVLNDMNEQTVGAYVANVWYDVLLAHLRCSQAFIVDNDPIEAFNNKCQLIQAFTKVLAHYKDENWILPVMYVSAVELRKLAKIADKVKQNRGESSAQVKPDECLEEAASQLMACFRICANDNRAAQEVSKRKGMINLINQLFKIYFRINKLHLCKPLTRALENANMKNQFNLAETVTYNYFTGMKALFDSDYKKAEQLLSFAFENCHPSSDKNHKLILIFLIPVKMLLGHMPSSQLLDKYQLQQFFPIIKAVKSGNLRQFDEALDTNADFFWNYGIYLILEKLKIIAYRNIFKKVTLILKTHQIPISIFVTAISHLQKDSVTLEEVHCILANLIFEGKIKGYISIQHQKLVISKQTPFPSLSSITG